MQDAHVICLQFLSIAARSPALLPLARPSKRVRVSPLAPCGRGVREKEKEIYKKQAKESGKPDKILDKIAEGKLEKFYQEVCLMEQPFIKNPDVTIKGLLDELIQKMGENILIRRFIRYQVGETAEEA